MKSFSILNYKQDLQHKPLGNQLNIMCTMLNPTISHCFRFHWKLQAATYILRGQVPECCGVRFGCGHAVKHLLSVWPSNPEWKREEDSETERGVGLGWKRNRREGSKIKTFTALHTNTLLSYCLGKGFMHHLPAYTPLFCSWLHKCQFCTLIDAA